MVAADLNRVRNVGERSSRIMLEQGCLAMDRFGRADDLAAGFENHRLMAKADAEERHFAFGEPHEIHAAAGVFRATGTGRDEDHCVRLPRLLERIFRGDLVADCAHARAEPFEGLDDVERETVVVVDHEDFAGHRDGSPAIADRIADAFRRVSCASAIGSESWTMPAPARTNAVPSLTSAERITTPVSSSPSPFS